MLNQKITEPEQLIGLYYRVKNRIYKIIGCKEFMYFRKNCFSLIVCDKAQRFETEPCRMEKIEEFSQSQNISDRIISLVHVGDFVKKRNSFYKQVLSVGGDSITIGLENCNQKVSEEELLNEYELIAFQSKRSNALYIQAISDIVNAV